MPYSDLGAYRFVSMGANRKVGSIYYENGRMRLVHDEGPMIEEYSRTEHIARFVVPNGIKIEYDYIYRHSIATVFNILIQINNFIRLLVDQTGEELLRVLREQASYATHAVNLLGNYGLNYGYLFEVYFHEELGFWVENGIHSSRGYPIIMNIEQNDRVFSDIYNYIRDYHETRRGNVLVFGTFEGYYTFYRKLKPFDIHNPYEYRYTMQYR